MSILIPRFARHASALGSSGICLAKKGGAGIGTSSGGSTRRIKPNNFQLLGLPHGGRCLAPTRVQARAYSTIRTRIPTRGSREGGRKALGCLAAFTLAGGLFPVLYAEEPGHSKPVEVAGLQGQMLEASNQEKEDARKPPAKPWWERILGEISLAFCDWVIEPIATTFRFIHLFTIFVPVIISVPAVYIGKRDKNRSNERSGTLWWYGFLVHSMERAGPTFIKVR